MPTRNELYLAMQELEDKQKELAAKIKEARENDLIVLARQLDNLLEENGFARSELLVVWGVDYPFSDLDEPIPGVKAPKPRKPKADGDTVRARTIYVLASDPKLTYAWKGPTPAWMKAAMTAAGMNPAVKADREKFRAEYLVQYETMDAIAEDDAVEVPPQENAQDDAA